MVGETVRFRAAKHNLLPNAPNDAARIGVAVDDGAGVQLHLGTCAVVNQGSRRAFLQHPALASGTYAIPHEHRGQSDLPAHLYWQLIGDFNADAVLASMMVACANGDTALVKPKG